MSAVGDFLFGSEGEPAEIVDVNPSAFQNLAGPVAGATGGLITSGGGPGAPQPFAAPVTGNENALLNQIFQQSTAPGLTAGARDALGATIRGDFLSPDSNPFLADTIRAAQRPLVETFQDITIPNIQSSFIRSGQDITPRGSSAFDRSAAIASRGFANALADIGTNLAGQNFARERTAQVNAAQAAPQFEAADLNRLVTGLQQQALPRLVEQLGIDRGLAEFNRRINVLLDALKIGTGQATPRTSTIQAQPGTPGFVQGLAPGIGQGIGGGIGDFIGGLFSDASAPTSGGALAGASGGPGASLLAGGGGGATSGGALAGASGEAGASLLTPGIGTGVSAGTQAGGGFAGTGLGAAALDASFAAAPLLTGAALSFGPVLAAKPLVDLLHDPVQDFGDTLSGVLGTRSSNTPFSSGQGNTETARLLNQQLGRLGLEEITDIGRATDTRAAAEQQIVQAFREGRIDGGEAQFALDEINSTVELFA